MPRVVLIAKSTYVWLDQLSRRYGRDIRTLDAIPDEELDDARSLGRHRPLADRAVGALEGVRSGSSGCAATPMRSRRPTRSTTTGSPTTSAARAPTRNLRDRAWRRGIRLASDMVPNHMGIDSRWVIEHPEWFLSLAEPPYPGVHVQRRRPVVRRPRSGSSSRTTTGTTATPRSSSSGSTADAATARYVYHGNDGTSFPWNDTAQLDFLDPAVREQVIRTILDVARRFPIIRFDAAMVLAKKHIQRLWWPEPGTGGGIPSRAEHAMTKAEFDARMPVEFWREVVDRVAAEVPGTLLLAEAFWLLEGYFVRTLGMHRVYNSAFMHMLRDEDERGLPEGDQGDHRVRSRRSSSATSTS